jgi:hypothetical protein
MAMERRKHHDIRNILGVLGTAVISAGLLSLLFLYYYGPSGRYIAGQTLLDPTLIEQIDYPYQHPRSGRKVHFRFGHITFSYFDSQQGEVRIPSISLETYQRFYTIVASEKSLQELTQNVQDLFFKSNPSLLTMSMRTMEEAENRVTKVFQFIQEDYFRVQLHQKNEGEWAYFYRPGLYQDVIHLFTRSTQ